MSIGREGPLIEFGGTLGDTLGRIGRTTLRHRRILVAAGTAAGFTSAYNTPFAAILFVFETIVGVAAPEALLPTVAATVVATTVTRALVGAGPIYGQRSFTIQSPIDMIWFTMLGLLAAPVAFGFKRLLGALETLAERHPLPQPLRATVGGAIVGAIAVVLPEVAGNGYEPLNVILDQRMLLATVAILMLAKIVATSASVASGIPGGVFTPTLLVGAALGSIVAATASLSTGGMQDAGSFALVGMAAATAAAIHAPITAAVLVFELSGDYAVVIPLLLATVLATSLSRFFGSESVYDRELHRRGVGWQLTLEGRIAERRTHL